MYGYIPAKGTVKIVRLAALTAFFQGVAMGQSPPPTSHRDASRATATTPQSTQNHTFTLV